MTSRIWYLLLYCTWPFGFIEDDHFCRHPLNSASSHGFLTSGPGGASIALFVQATHCFLHQSHSRCRAFSYRYRSRYSWWYGERTKQCYCSWQKMNHSILLATRGNKSKMLFWKHLACPSVNPNSTTVLIRLPSLLPFKMPRSLRLSSWLSMTTSFCR